MEVISRARTPRTLKRLPKPGQDRRFSLSALEVSHIEQITAADVSTFLGAHVRSRGLAPKTANRYREVLHHLYRGLALEHGLGDSRIDQGRQET